MTHPETHQPDAPESPANQASDPEGSPPQTAGKGAGSGSGAPGRPGDGRRGRGRAFARELTSIAAACAVVLLARSSLADHYRVPTESMVPTVEAGDHVVVNKLAYGLRLPLTHSYPLTFDGPRRGDVVVLDSPEQDVVLLKRVVATPGDEIEVRSGQLWLGGQAVAIVPVEGGLREALGSRGHMVRIDDGGGPDFGPVRIPEGAYLVMGDNRGNSHDGRMFGLVPRGNILGKAAALYRAGGGLHRL
jgi:signal peptidase I